MLLRSGESGGPFRVHETFADPLRRSLLRLSKPLLESALGFGRLNDMYAGLRSRGDPRHFVELALESLGVRYEIPDEDLGRIPASGSLVVVANHPFGGLDGLILASVLLHARPGVRLLGNSLLRAIPDLRDLFFFVDPFGGPGAPARNAGALRSAIRWVREGNALVVFPSGEVSHLNLRRRAVLDPPWSPSLGRIVRQSRAAALPVYFEGRNSALFQLAGLVHPRLRTALLARELARAHKGPIPVRIGSVIPAARLEDFDSPEGMTFYLRARTYVLSGRGRESGKRKATREPDLRDDGTHLPGGAAPTPPPGPAEELAREIAALPQAAKLVESSRFEVYIGRAHEIPATLREIGRLREIAFRAAGEGTGRAIDLDRFDEHYLHLFVWDRETWTVVGGYRAGPTDLIVPRHGLDGLYTSTLFRFRPSLLEEIGPALELGRSFVRPESQKEHSPLALLWKGIGHYVAANPRYRRLFGPVSISNTYRSMSRLLLMAFLNANHSVASLRRLVRPRNRALLPRARIEDPSLVGAVVSRLDAVDELIAEIEADRKGMPVLLRQYLRLNARLLGFNVDPDFGDVLDGLMLVDLVAIDRAILVRFMGREAASSFLAAHGASL